MGKPAHPHRITVRLASPRGFCAGVERAILIVQRALAKYGAPVFVRHEIVHNKIVVNRLAAMGAVFVEELDEIPPTDQPVIFSAHGVPKSVPRMARARAINYIDATCPLVSKVHRETQRHIRAGRNVILIGHSGHPEVVGTMGQVEGQVEGQVDEQGEAHDKTMIYLIEKSEDIDNLPLDIDQELGLVTQTTLSVDETRDLVGQLFAKFPRLILPKQEDICYATTNRQRAVKEIAQGSDLLLVVGSKNSSNSLRLLEVGRSAGVTHAFLIDDYHDIQYSWLENVHTIALSAGASAPEDLVEDVLRFLAENFTITIERADITEDLQFKLPRQLTEAV